MDKLLRSINKEYVVLASIVGIIVTWTMFSARLLNAEQKISALEQVINSINNINVKIAVIEEKITNIDGKLK